MTNIYDPHIVEESNVPTLKKGQKKRERTVHFRTFNDSTYYKYYSKTTYPCSKL